tara:strand:+ start:1275 stop:2810 length:1536 start_codon:yes stop_codon:yes gene_type:complete
MLDKYHNPDILSCLSNLSNDEVFTPPTLANEMLDTLPAEYWSDKTKKFLDPVSKSGVLLREITKRLLEGLENQIPNIEDRLNHILKNQVFGIGITKLTAEISRRTLYCSKRGNGPYSIVKFKDEEGNIKYFPTKHYWEAWASGPKCRYCGISKKLYDRDENLESYAYSFIHNSNPEDFFEMKFDVIIGNPPYQMNDGGGTGSSAVPIYDKFVEAAKKLKPRYITMIIPARWYSGGRGLDVFRENMLRDRSIKELYDFTNSSDCFSGVEIKGGVCFFLWERDYQGECKVVSKSNSKVTSIMKRPLLEDGLTNFIRRNEMVSIIKKVRKFKEKTFDEIISSNDPFGFDVREVGSYKRVKPKFSLEKYSGQIPFYYQGWKKEGLGYINESNIIKNKNLIKKDKIYIPKAWGTGNLSSDQLEPIFVEGKSCSTETYLVISSDFSKEEFKNICHYINTKFFHALTLALKNTQNAMKKVYSIVPIQDFKKKLNDNILYQKYNLTKEEIDFIEKNVLL